MKSFKYFPDVWGALAFLFFIFSLEMAVAIVFYDFGVMFELGDPRGSVVSVVAHGIFFSFFIYFSGLTYKQLFHPTSNSISGVLFVTLVPVSIVVVASLGWLGDLEMFIASLFSPDLESEQMLFEFMNHGVVTILAACLVAPMLEEMLFRGVILRGFLRHYSPLNAILASSVLFGVMHLNIYQIPGAFIFGCFVGWLFYLTRSLWPCIFAHALANAMAYIYFFNNKETYFEADQHVYNSLMANLLTLVLSLMCCYLMYKIFSKTQSKNNQ